MKIAFLCLSLLLSGCATQKFTLHQNSTNTANVDDMQAFFLNGIGQIQRINAASICGGANKVAHVEVQQTFIDGFLGMLTWGIYTPRSARVFCLKN